MHAEVQKVFRGRQSQKPC